MVRKDNQQTLDFLLVFGANFLSNFSAIFGDIWLIPRMVLAETILWSILVILSVWILFRHNILFSFFKNLKTNWIVLPFLFFSGFSIFWSISRDISFYRWVILLFTIIIGGCIGLRYSIQDYIKLLSGFGVFILLLSAILVFFVPNIGIMNYHEIQGAWKGLYWHKNHMGLIATFINILFLINFIYSARLKGRQKFTWSLLYIISLLFIYQSDSVAAYITTLSLNGGVLLALIWLKFRNKIRSYHYLYIFLVILLISLILYFNIDHIFGVFNRNTSLTGRIPMWSYLYNAYIIKRPIGGYGFNAFWYDEAHRVAVQQAAGYPDPIVISDNGFIDILVNTGFIGLILFLVLYFGIWWRSIKYALIATNINGFFPIVVMSFTLIANVSWSLIFENESFFMLIMISLLFCISKNEI